MVKSYKSETSRQAWIRSLVMLSAMVLMLTGSLLAQSAPQAKIESGMLSGSTDANGVAAYLGIPFAQPPVGDLRWRPPQPLAPWTGVREARQFGANCPQDHGAFGPYTEEFISQGDFSEDCLFLNVWTVGNSKTDKQPVMVYIYGGAFMGGSGSVAIYNGAALARKGVVVVTFNYRVGQLGFLVHPELSKESPHHVSGNYGLLDQIAALQWVKKNIQAFGGDPANVTIFGQSAGAMSVADLMTSPLAAGLFARGIEESGPAILRMPAMGGNDLQAREAAGVKFAESHGAHSLAELRALPAEEIARTAGGGMPIGGGPVTDGYVLPAEPLAHQVPLLVGMVTGDTTIGAAMMGQQPPSTVAAFQQAAQHQFGAAADQFLKLYPVTQDSDVPAMEKASAVEQARVTLDLWAANQATRSGTVYTYDFDRPIPWPAHPEFGAFHTADVPYVFQNLKVLDRPWEKADFQLSNDMSSYWTNFAKTGNPNGKGLPAWPAYVAGKHVTMELGEHVGAIPDAGPAPLQFFLNHRM